MIQATKDFLHRHVVQRAKDAWRHGTLKARSHKWPALCRELERAPGYRGCAACGTRDEVEWHHIISFHAHPELELNKANLIPLCMDRKPGGTVRECHLRIGHKGNWKTNNPNVAADAAKQLASIRELEKPYTDAGVKIHYV